MRRCGYCDFNTYTGDFGPGAERGSYAATLMREIDFSKDALQDNPPQPLSSVFFGGGTPSLLPAQHIVDILARLQESFGLAPGAEITLEANPDTIDLPYLETLLEGGVNRISMGMQSAVPAVLRTLDRTHSPENVARAAGWMTDLGCNFSVDLIYGAPAETLEQWNKTLMAAIELEPNHISAYSLILEPGTALYRKVKSGQYPAVQDDDMADKYELADDLLRQAGYHWYELSNFARTERDRSVHNQAYWQGANWWGYGPGAHSHLNGTRWWNVKHPRKYRDLLQEGRSPREDGEVLSATEIEFERLMLQLRTVQGYRFGVNVSDEDQSRTARRRTAIDGLVAEGYITVRDEGDFSQSLQLTLKGRLMADYVTRALADVMIVDDF